MNEQIRESLARERMFRVRALEHERKAREFRRLADDARLAAWRLQQRAFQQRYEPRELAS